MSGVNTQYLTTSAGAIHAPGLATRQTDQSNRIATGMDSGAITPSDAKTLEGQYKTLNTQAAADKITGSGGTVNGEQRAQLNGQYSAISQEIFSMKHPDA